MATGREHRRLDWLVEFAGALAPAIAAGYAAARLAPVLGWPIASLMFGAGIVVFAAAFAVMRMIPAEPHFLALPAFTVESPDDELLLDQPYRANAALDELLLDQVLVEAASEAVAELLLDDPLPATAPESRVVQLFADGRMPTAGQLVSRIDQHLAEGGKAEPASDASDALSEALAELRRSLRQA